MAPARSQRSVSSGFRNHPNAVLPKLGGGGRSRRTRERVRATLALRERGDVAQRLGTRQKHGKAVDAEGDAAVGRRAHAQGPKQEREFRLGLLLAHAEHREDPPLHLGAMISDGPAADLVAVQDEVVLARSRLAGTLLEVGLVLRLGSRERVVAGLPAVLVRQPLEHWKPRHPEEVPALLDETEPLAEVEAQ